jgi:hypothetical protein
MDRWLKRANPTSSLLTTAAKKAKADDAAPSSSVTTSSSNAAAAAAAASAVAAKASPAAAASDASDGAMMDSASSSSLSVQITEQQVFTIGGMSITAAGWAAALSNEFSRPYFTKLLTFLKAQKDKGKVYSFAKEHSCYSNALQYPFQSTRELTTLKTNLFLLSADVSQDYCMVS